MKSDKPRDRWKVARSGRRGRGAFTLVELLVVVILIGLVATGVTLSMRGATEPARLRAATLQIEQVLRQARHWAIRHRQPVWLQFQLGSVKYRTVRAAEDRGPGAPSARAVDMFGAWQTLDGVVVASAAVGVQIVDADAGEPFTVRIMPSGASLPWAAELRAGTAHRVIVSDGITSRVQVRPDLALNDQPRMATSGGGRS